MAFNLGPAYVVVPSPEQDAVAIRNFFVLPDERWQGYERRLWQALTSRYPDIAWLVPAVSPEEYGGFFQNLGFEPDRLSQFQMERACGSQN
jgi:GNAT superfamily N-acetyltransferase